jgi:tRNA (adenine57-N1/adenine58-N1)-methyltransferase
MKDKELALLYSDDCSYIAEAGKKEMHTKDGVINLSALRKKKFGDVIKTHLGKEFRIIKPSLIDLLNRKMRRLPQIIMPKDIALILAYTGISPGSKVVDAGTGSAYLSIFLANYIRPGKIFTYEVDKKFAKSAKKNIEDSGFSNFITMKRKDITKGVSEKNVDLVTLDMKDAEKVVKHAYKALSPGGYIVVYSP